MRWRGFAVSLIAFVATAETSAAQAEVIIALKSGVPAKTILDVNKACEAQAQATPFNRGVVPVTPNLYGALAVGVISGVMVGVQHNRDVRTARTSCLHQHGYTRLALTDEEAKAFRSLKDDASREAWVDKLNGSDWALRLPTSPARPGALPSVTAAPYTIRGLRIDPVSLVVATDPLGYDGIIFTATATHQATATLKANYYLGGRFDQTLPAGTVLHAVDYDGVDPDVGELLWCGGRLKVKKDEMPVCVWRSERGYNFSAVDESADWLAAPYAIETYRLTQRGDDFILAPNDKDLIGPVKLVMKVGWLGAKTVDVSLIAVRGGEAVQVWQGTWALKFNGNTEAEIPFWNSRLHITVQDEKVRPSLTPDGDGKGWLEADAELGVPTRPTNGDPVSNKPVASDKLTESGMATVGRASNP